MKTVWVLMLDVPYQHPQMLGLYSTEQLANEAKMRVMKAKFKNDLGSMIGSTDLLVLENTIDGPDSEWPLR